ncbi:MAG: hypothetical protein P1S46_10125 [bacterium]|nr:hypothetical protein [bacterium]
MKRIKMNGTFKALGVLLAVAVMACGLVLPQPASAALPAPNFMPGFPMLAGPQIIIMWSPIPGAVKYNVYMNGKKITESIAMQFIAPAPTAGGEYKYQVSAVDAAGAESPLSVESLINIIILEPPGNLAVLPSETRITVRWNTAPGALIYDVFRKVKGEGEFKMVSSVNTTRYDDATPEAGKTYEYAVKSKDSSGKASSFSPSAEAQLLVVEAPAADEKKIPRLLVPTTQVTQIFMEFGGFDMEIFGKEALVTANKLYYFPNITTPATMEDYEEIFPNEDHLRGLAVCDGRVFVIQSRPQRVIKELSLANRTVVNQFPIPAPKPGELVYGEKLDKQKVANPNPYDLVCDLDGNLIISDPDNFRLVRYTADGELIETVGFDPDAELIPEPRWKVDTPKYLKIDKDGEVLISSIFTIEGFDSEGNERIKSTGNLGSNIGQFSSIYGIDLTQKGNLYAADIRASNVQIFRKDEDGNWEFHWSVTNKDKSGNLAIASPSGIAVSEDEKYLFVLEGIAKRIGVFQLLWDQADQRPEKTE